MLKIVMKSTRWLYIRLVEKVGVVILRQMGVDCAGGLVLYGLPIVSLVPNSTIRVGKRVVLCSSSKYTALGVNHPVVLRTLSPGAEIALGDDVGISGGSICAASRIEIGSRTMLGADVTIADTDFHSLHSDNRRYRGQDGANTSPVIIGENVFIGTGAVVLKGVSIGSNSVIGARSVVVSDIPGDVIAAGNPCRVIRPLPNSGQTPDGGVQ